ncbi:hypothetical protein EG329_006196 [Mollisiaceae sp. DMI_Dod_QoI]|nr:hypothetical protein EG329_006196 [Helotiales sp. DMI_Dod_QoI]
MAFRGSPDDAGALHSLPTQIATPNIQNSASCVLKLVAFLNIKNTEDVEVDLTEHGKLTLRMCYRECGPYALNWDTATVQDIGNDGQVEQKSLEVLEEGKDGYSRVVKTNQWLSGDCPYFSDEISLDPDRLRTMKQQTEDRAKAALEDSE